jgi:hypothetical protein
VPGQVEQLAPHLLGGQAEERPRRIGVDRLQGPEQAEQGILEVIFRVDKAADLSIPVDQLPGE